MKLLLKNVRLAFPNLWTATTVNGEGKPAFSASFLLPKNHPQIEEIRKAMRSVAKAKWAAKADAVYAIAEKTDKLALHDGDTKAQYGGFEGNLFVASRSQVRPSVFGPDLSPLSESDGKPYAGCYVNANIEFWAQDNNYGKRINAQLRGVQFLRDGDSFGGGSGAAAEDEFENLADTEDDPTK